MICNNCQNPHAARMLMRVIDGQVVSCCDECGAPPCNPCPDVYMGPAKGVQTNENICDDNGAPIPFSSKREKALIMKQRGLRQADCAEKQRGGRLDSYTRRTYFT